MSPLSVDQLPDDVVVEVLRLLSIDDVLTCRLVCKRLGTLALHQDVWRRRRVVDDKPCVCAVLRLAPCLAVIRVSSMLHLSGFDTTKCASAKLVIELESKIHPAVYALAVRNQEALGRLRHVVVITDWGPPLVGADPLLKTLAASSCLESLDVDYFQALATRHIQCVPSKSSLKIFRCSLRAASVSFVNAVLAGHAATLEEVKLNGGHTHWDKVDQLASMPKLKWLSCDMLPRLEALAACKTLTHMELYLEDRNRPSYEPLMDGAVRFLRHADQLRALTINFSSLQQHRRLCEKLMDALPSPRRPLEQLHLGGLPDVQLLFRVLPRLPTLRQLLVSEVMTDYLLLLDELLLGITPTSAPGLRRLELSDDQLGADAGEVCGHTWLHGDAVKAALTANPALHIHLHEPRSCERPDCAACALGCHQQVSWNDERLDGRLVVFSHDPANCPSLIDHATDPDTYSYGGIWSWVHVQCNSA